METDRETINKLLKSSVVPLLRKLGFKGTFPHFKRFGENKIDLLMFQFSQFGKGFIIEIAQCNLNGVTFANGEKIPPEKVKVFHCFPPNRTRIPIKEEDKYCWITYEKKNLNKIPNKIISLITNEAIPWWNNKQIFKSINNMKVNITFFAHGTTTDNEKNISSGWKDVELSKLGLQQSIDLKKQIDMNKFDVVFCSDQKRAVHSSTLTFEGTVKIIQDARLRECNYGTYNGMSSDIVEPLQEECTIKRFPEGESYNDVKKRIADFLEFLKKNYAGKNVAIVSHKAPQLALDVLLKGQTWEQAFTEDWRKKKKWQPGWEYKV